MTHKPGPTEIRAETPISIGRAVDLLKADYPDISPSTLRFLESEGLLEPQRTPGGHRLYGPEDIERVRFIRTMQRRRLSLDEIRERLNRLDRFGDSPALCDNYYALVVAGNLPAAAQLIRDADRFGLPLATTFADVIGEAMRRIGTAWETGELIVGQEKEATELAKELVAELSARHATTVTKQEVVLAAAVEGELHDLGLRMVAGLLREQGYLVHLLGPDVAAGFLIESVRLRRPSILLLGITLPERIPALVKTVEEVRRVFPGRERPQIIVGGPIIADHYDRLESLEVALAAATGVRAAARAIMDHTMNYGGAAG